MLIVIDSCLFFLSPAAGGGATSLRCPVKCPACYSRAPSLESLCPATTLPNTKAAAECAMLRHPLKQRGEQQANGQNTVPLTKKDLLRPAPTHRRALHCITDQISNPGGVTLLQSWDNSSYLVHLSRRCFHSAPIFGGLVVHDACHLPF